MKRKCIVLLILTILICMYLQLAGCQKKVEAPTGPTQEEIASEMVREEARYLFEEAAEAEAERVEAEAASRARLEYDRLAAEESEEEFSLNEIVVTGSRIERGKSAVANRAAFKRKRYFDGPAKGKVKLELSSENEGLGTELWIIEKTSLAIGDE